MTQNTEQNVRMREAFSGYLFHNPDTGTEWNISHPIESGECQYATDIQHATFPKLISYLQEAWSALERSESERKREIKEAEARGAEEQRRKDGEGSDEALDEVMIERDNAEEFIRKFAERVLGHSVEWSSSYGFGSAFIDVADRVDALEAEIASLKEAEQLARADAEACRARVKVLEEALVYLEEEARRFASHYTAHSDGWNTFIIFADKIHARAALTREGGV